MSAVTDRSCDGDGDGDGRARAAAAATATGSEERGRRRERRARVATATATGREGRGRWSSWRAMVRAPNKSPVAGLQMRFAGRRSSGLNGPQPVFALVPWPARVSLARSVRSWSALLIEIGSIFLIFSR